MHNGLRFFGDCAEKKWPLRGSSVAALVAKGAELFLVRTVERGTYGLNSSRACKGQGPANFIPYPNLHQSNLREHSTRDIKFIDASD